MKTVIFIVLTISLIIAIQFVDLAGVEDDMPKYTIVLHGGAGTISKSIPDSVKKEYISSLTRALNIGKEILEKKGSSLDAVEAVVRFLEDDPKFNAGKGAVFTAEGKHELDASIMDGRDLSSGAAASVTNVKNPITLARLIMTKTPHVLFTGKGAEQIAAGLGVELVDNEYFHDRLRYEQWLKSKEKSEENRNGTVGCVALDMHGNLAAATSTGGMTNKPAGRIGDSPLINAGTYANNKTCAVSATGHGELFIKNTIAFNISALMEYKGFTLNEAADEMIYKRLKPGDGGIIAVDKDGNYVMPFNTPGMFRGAATSDGVFKVEIWK